MANVLNPKVQATGLTNVFLMGLSKHMTERILNPYIGNATATSAIVKGVGGGLMYGKAGKLGNIVSSGLVVDAAEDAAFVVSNMIFGGKSEAAGSDW